MQTKRIPVSPLFVNPFSAQVALDQRLFFLMRLGILFCFVGHGFWGLMGKSGWVPFFGAYGISEEWAYWWMPIIGFFDIAVGLFCFLYPTRALIAYAAFWTLFTATLRPSAAMGMAEFYERAGNYGVPLALLYLSGLPGASGWFSKLKASDLLIHQPARLSWLERILRVFLFFLLAGHGGLVVFNEGVVIGRHMSVFGLEPGSQGLLFFGIFEIGLGLLVLLVPRLPGLMLFVLFYKVCCESMYPLLGRPVDIFETLERFGDYVIPLMLWILYRHLPTGGRLKSGRV